MTYVDDDMSDKPCGNILLLLLKDSTLKAVHQRNECSLQIRKFQHSVETNIDLFL